MVFKKGYTPWNKGLEKEKQPKWKGGKRRTPEGYILIYSFNHPHLNYANYVLEHRLVMEKYLRRFLKPSEIVHHKNEVKDDNRLSNLKLFPNQKEHTLFHKALRRALR